MMQWFPWMMSRRITEVVVKAGDTVSKGDVLCGVDTVNDSTIQMITAPMDGKIGWIASVGSLINCGAPVAIYGKLSGVQNITRHVKETPRKTVAG